MSTYLSGGICNKDSNRLRFTYQSGGSSTERNVYTVLSCANCVQFGSENNICSMCNKPFSKSPADTPATTKAMLAGIGVALEAKNR